MTTTTSAFLTFCLLTLALPTLASEKPAPESATPTGTAMIVEAIDRGVPLFNSGDHEGCARVYEETARRILALGGPELSLLDRHELAAALDETADAATARAWSLRNAFDRVLTNARFEVRVEAPLPEGFPGPGPLGRVVVKEYPRYRAARAAGGGSFRALFQHIDRNDVRMTTPVEMTMNERMVETEMAFLYEAPDQGRVGTEGRVRVLDLEPMTVLSVGMRGRRNQEALRLARSWIEDHIEREGWSVAGTWRTLGYNSPMVPAAQSFWEVQVPVTRD